MMRALFSGVSGLRNHLVRMDVIGNNIANVNTVAFKSSRVTFEEAFTQLVQGASRPLGELGGVNPIQVGLGMSVASIDQNFTQGNLNSTGVTTDLAIQGDGFFTVSDGTGLFYTRAGNFRLDADGRLVSPANGFIVQGVLADNQGKLSGASAPGNIVLPFGQKSPARATTEITISGNLDSRAQPRGTILTMKGSVLAVEQTTSNGGLGTDVADLYANGAADTAIVGLVGDRSTVTVSDGTTSQTYTYVELDTGAGDLAFRSLNDLVAEINNDFTTLSAALDDATGAIVFSAAAGGGGVSLDVSSSSSTLSKALATVNGLLAAGASISTDEFSHVAGANDLLVNLRNGGGETLNLADGQTILIDGTVGEASVAQGSLSIVGASSTYGDLLAQVDDTFGIANSDGVEADGSTGSMVLSADGGLANELTGVNVRVSGAADEFNAIFDSRPGNYLERQAASDVVHDVAITAFDSIGNPHVVNVRFVKDPTETNRWTWQATVPDPAVPTDGDTGSVTFDSNGRLESFIYDGGAASFQFAPNSGATGPAEIRLNVGETGSIIGLSQFASTATAVASGQDGYPMGDLQNIAIDGQGIITGFFTNGVGQQLARISIATFNNPTGLLPRGDNMFEESANSGAAVIGFAGGGGRSSITPGALEASNVDLSEEFTEMIIAQRGFQANARVITTADEMLTELVNLKR